MLARVTGLLPTNPSVLSLAHMAWTLAVYTTGVLRGNAAQISREPITNVCQRLWEAACTTLWVQMWDRRLRNCPYFKSQKAKDTMTTCTWSIAHGQGFFLYELLWWTFISSPPFPWLTLQSIVICRILHQLLLKHSLLNTCVMSQTLQLVHWCPDRFLGVDLWLGFNKAEAVVILLPPVTSTALSLTSSCMKRKL